MTLIVVVILELNSGQALTNPPAGGQDLIDSEPRLRRILLWRDIC